MGLPWTRRNGKPNRRHARRATVWIALALVALAGLAVGAVKVQQARQQARSQAEASRVVRAYLRAWSAGDMAAAAAQVGAASQDAARTLLTATRAQLRPSATVYELAGPVRVTGRPGTTYRAAVQMPGVGTARWSGQVPLVRQAGVWRVAFAPSVVHPALTTGGRFAVVRTAARRGRLLTAGGQSLNADRDLSDNLGGVVAVAKAGPALPAGAVAGDMVGRTGLQRIYERTLAGQSGGAVTVRDPAGRVVATVLSTPTIAGRDVRTTLDLRIQRAGERAVAEIPQPGALVAIDSATGRILALVNHPASGLRRAVAGKGPPGSTFKIVTSAAALIAGVPPSTVLNCSPTVRINGRSFQNAEQESAGPIGWRQAFAKSCNTWFVRLQQQVPLQTLSSTSALFGFGVASDPARAQKLAMGILPVSSFGGSYPIPRDRAQAAGQAIGQDLVLASPLQMASVAAAVADGTWRQPVVVGNSPKTTPLPPGVAATLRSFMAAVPQPGGTAAGAGLPAGTSGKTGTAETAASNLNPQQTDSWFVGYRGRIAFALEFDRAGFGAQVAAPAAARFLRALG